MRTIQDKVLGAIEERINRATTEVVVSNDYANRGQIMVMQDLRIVATWRFDFQHGSFTIDDTYINWLEGDRPAAIENLVDRLVEEVERKIGGGRG